MAGSALADEQRYQLCGAVSHGDKGGGDLTVVRDGGFQGNIVPVRIAADDIQIFCQSFFDRGGQPQRIDIGSKAYDVLLFDMVICLDLLQITAVEGGAVRVFHTYSSIFLVVVSKTTMLFIG